LFVVDFKGKRYRTIKDMCDDYGINPSTYALRRERGMTVKEALTTPLYSNERSKYQNGRHKVTDHLGKEYSSVDKMCKAHGTTLHYYKKAMAEGKSVEEALEKPVRKNVGHIVYDHLGNMYYSKKEMCEAYGISFDAFSARRRKGMSLEEALTKKPFLKDPEDAIDTLGNVFKNKTAMCMHYGIPLTTYDRRLERGWSKEEALGLKERKRASFGNTVIKDHLGNEYSSKKKMCEHYGISVYTFKDRIKKGMSLEDALKKEKRICEDPFGKTFQNKTEMCEFYGVRFHTYEARLRSGWTQEEALEITKRTDGRTVRPCTDPLGNKFKSKTEMCEFYHVSNNSYYSRLKYGWSEKEALGIEKRKSKLDIKKMPCVDPLGNTFESKSAMCKYHGISYTLYYGRIKIGWTEREALEIDPRKKSVGEKTNNA